MTCRYLVIKENNWAYGLGVLFGNRICGITRAQTVGVEPYRQRGSTVDNALNFAWCHLNGVSVCYVTGCV
jgi:hypothetical protein